MPMLLRIVAGNNNHKHINFLKSDLSSGLALFHIHRSLKKLLAPSALNTHSRITTRPTHRDTVESVQTGLTNRK